MASSFSESNFDLNVVSDAQPSFQSQNGHITVNDFVMLNDTNAAAVAVVSINPLDEKLLANMLKPLMTHWHSPSNVLPLFQI
jgi:hypothetical protein